MTDRKREQVIRDHAQALLASLDKIGHSDWTPQDHQASVVAANALEALSMLVAERTAREVLSELYDKLYAERNAERVARDEALIYASDPDYSPIFQDEYQRLWQQATVEVKGWQIEWRKMRQVANEARQALAAYRSALRSGEPESEQLKSLSDAILSTPESVG